MDKKINEENYTDELSALSGKINWDWKNIQNSKI
jgi:hypothetical protein